jgi:hypothetical protein
MKKVWMIVALGLMIIAAIAFVGCVEEVPEEEVPEEIPEEEVPEEEWPPWPEEEVIPPEEETMGQRFVSMISGLPLIGDMCGSCTSSICGMLGGFCPPCAV